MNKKEELNKDLNPYANDKIAKIPSWLKILLLKFWVAGATFFFFGVANELVDATAGNAADIYFVFISFGMGLMNEYITKNIVRFMKNSRDNTYYYNMVNQKGVLSLFLNILYGFVTVFPIVFIASFLASKGLVWNFFGAEGFITHREFVDFDYASRGLNKFGEGVQVASGAMVVDRHNGVVS